MNFRRESMAVELALRLAARGEPSARIVGWPNTREGLACAMLERAGGLTPLTATAAAQLRFAEPGPIGTAWPVAVDQHDYLITAKGHRLRTVAPPVAQP